MKNESNAPWKADIEEGQRRPSEAEVCQADLICIRLENAFETLRCLDQTAPVTVGDAGLQGVVSPGVLYRKSVIS